MDNISTKEELDAKAEEVDALWLLALEAKRVAVACEDELKDMRFRYYANGVSYGKMFDILKDGG